MTRGAGTDGAVGIRPPDALALLVAAGHGRLAFQRGERVRRAPGVSRVILLGETDLLGRECLFAIHRGTRNARVPAAQELLVDRLVAAAAISRRRMFGDHEPVMLVLPVRQPADDTPGRSRSSAHGRSFRVREPRGIAAGRGTPHISRGAHQGRIGLAGVGSGPGPVHQKGADGQSKADDDRDKDSSEAPHTGPV